MSFKKRSAPLSFILALSLALLSVFSGSDHFVAAAPIGPVSRPQPTISVSTPQPTSSVPTAQPQSSSFTPQPQSPEEMRLPTCSLGSECGTPIPITSACKSVHTYCEDVGGVPTCVARDVFDQGGQVCELGGGCYPPSVCDNSGRCQPSGAVNCSGNTTECETWGCANWPVVTCEKTETKPAVAAECVAVDDPIVCGQTYWRRFNEVKPAQCGGASCPAAQQLTADPCTPPGFEECIPRKLNRIRTRRLRNPIPGTMCPYTGNSAYIDMVCAGLSGGFYGEIEFEVRCESMLDTDPSCPLNCWGWGGSSNPDVKEYIGLTPQQVADLEGYGTCLRYYYPYSPSNLPNCG